MIVGLENDFVRLAEPSLLEIALPEQEWDNAEKEYRILNTHYGLQIHTGFLVSAMSLDDAKRRMQDFPETLKFLRKRLLNRLQIGGNKWLWKSAIHSDADEIEALLAVLQKHGPNALLWVTLGDAAHPPPSVMKLQENLFRGYICKSSGPWAGDWSEGRAWVDLLGVAETVLPSGKLPTPELLPPLQGSKNSVDEAYHLLYTIVAAQIDNPDLKLGLEMSPADVDGWDSLKHINIILAAESRLGTSFTQAELEAMLNVGDFVTLIAGRLPRPNVFADDHQVKKSENGFITLNNSCVENHPVTVIVSGLGDTGCFLAGKILSSFGIESANDIFNAVLVECDYSKIGQIIAHRNESKKPWGLLVPSIHERILPGKISMFRNPGLIFVMQDSVAVATETPAELGSPEKAYLDAVNSANQAVGFLERAACPTLLLSYENIIKFPDETSTAIAEFCGLTTTDDLIKKAAPKMDDGFQGRRAGE